MVKKENFMPSEWTGLTSIEAGRRLEQFGPNQLTTPKRGERLKEILHTLADPMALLLLLAASTYFLLGDNRDGLILLAALIPVLGVDVVLEAQSRDALKKLSQAFSPRARVLRDGLEKEIPTTELVPGDLLVLKEGDKAHADGVLRQAANLSMDESQLTGESEPRQKIPGVGPEPGEDSLFLAGSTVMTGHALGEIQKTGASTRFGGIARLVADSEPESTPLQKKTDFLVKRLGLAALVVALGLAGLELYRGKTLGESFLSVVSLTIAAMPEEFPLVFTLFLSLGAWRLAKRGVLVKRLASVETLGSTTVICVDKTGTLTQGKFLLDTHTPLGPDGTEEEVLEASVLACEISPADPMEKAILAHAQEHGVKIARVQEAHELAYDYDFDLAGKHMSHVWRDKDGKGWRIVAKGALEGILEHCEITAEERKKAEVENARLALRGARVLAVAERKAVAFTGQRVADEKGLKLLGLLAFKDPLRPEVPQAVAQCREAGIKIKIITGDHLLTAQAVATAAGILHGDNELVNGPALAKLPLQDFQKRVTQGVIFARVDPAQKHAIVDVLRDSGEVVAMTGDGINDAPALKKADIGIAMGLKGTEVARAAADIVLLQDSFAAIVETVAEGRRIFANIQRSFFFLLAFHVPIVVLALLCPLAGLPLLYLPVHLVWLELVVHPVSALVFEAEPAPPDAMRQPPRNPEEPLLPDFNIVISLVSGLLLSAVVAGFFVARLPQGVTYARSCAMAALILGSLVLTFAERAQNQSWWKVPFPKTKRFWIVTLGVGLSLPAIIELPGLDAVFQVSPITPRDWAIAALLGFAAIAWRSVGLRKNVRPHA